MYLAKKKANVLTPEQLQKHKEVGVAYRNKNKSNSDNADLEPIKKRNIAVESQPRRISKAEEKRLKEEKVKKLHDKLFADWNKPRHYKLKSHGDIKDLMTPPPSSYSLTSSIRDSRKAMLSREQNRSELGRMSSKFVNQSFIYVSTPLGPARVNTSSINSAPYHYSDDLWKSKSKNVSSTMGISAKAGISNRQPRISTLNKGQIYGKIISDRNKSGSLIDYDLHDNITANEIEGLEQKLLEDKNRDIKSKLVKRNKK